MTSCKIKTVKKFTFNNENPFDFFKHFLNYLVHKRCYLAYWIAKLGETVVDEFIAWFNRIYEIILVKNTGRTLNIVQAYNERKLVLEYFIQSMASLVDFILTYKNNTSNEAGTDLVAPRTSLVYNRGNLMNNNELDFQTQFSCYLVHNKCYLAYWISSMGESVVDEFIKWFSKTYDIIVVNANNRSIIVKAYEEEERDLVLKYFIRSLISLFQ